jgi:hypothetical protein
MGVEGERKIDGENVVKKEKGVKDKEKPGIKVKQEVDRNTGTMSTKPSSKGRMCKGVGVKGAEAQQGKGKGRGKVERRAWSDAESLVSTDSDGEAVDGPAPKQIKINRQLSVNEIKNLDYAPTYYPDPPANRTQAFLVDGTSDNGVFANQEDSMDQILRDAVCYLQYPSFNCLYLLELTRLQDMDSWGISVPGTSGGSTNPAKGSSIPILSKNCQCRRRKLVCEGALFCERFDFKGVDLGDDYRREVIEGSESVEWAGILRKERERRGEIEKDDLYRTAEYDRTPLSVTLGSHYLGFGD